MADVGVMAPELQVDAWLHSSPLTLASLRGRVVALHFFQMLCPGCVVHGLPLVEAIRRHFRPDEVAVIGVHSVFEHHDVMTPKALEAFAHEYRLHYPITVDQAGDGPVPRTMQAYGLRGTPSLVLVDKAGRIRLHRFGRTDDMEVGAVLGALCAESGTCSGEGCALVR